MMKTLENSGWIIVFQNSCMMCQSQDSLHEDGKYESLEIVLFSRFLSPYNYAILFFEWLVILNIREDCFEEVVQLLCLCKFFNIYGNHGLSNLDFWDRLPFFQQ